MPFGNKKYTVYYINPSQTDALINSLNTTGASNQSTMTTNTIKSYTFGEDYSFGDNQKSQFGNLLDNVIFKKGDVIQGTLNNKQTEIVTKINGVDVGIPNFIFAPNDETPITSCSLPQYDKQSGTNWTMSSISKATLVAIIAFIILIIFFKDK